MKEAWREAMEEGYEYQYETRAVAGIRYMKNSPGEPRTHAVALANGEPLCGRVKAASLLDDREATDPHAAPTCPVCAKRDPRREL